MSDFDDLDDELLGLGGEADDSGRDAGAVASDSESEGAVSDSSADSSKRRKKAGGNKVVVTSPSPAPAPAGGASGNGVGAKAGIDISDAEDDSDAPMGKRKTPAGGSAAGRKRASPGDDFASPPKKKAKSTGRKAAAPKRRKGRDSDDDELSDEDAMDVSDNESDYGAARGTAAMSSDEDDSDGDEEGPTSLYPYEKWYKDAADFARIQALPEVEREQILAERQEDNWRMKERRELSAHVNKNKKLAKANKDKEMDELLSTANRRSTRGESSAKKTADSKKNQQLTELMKKRDEKNARKAGVSDDRSKKRRSSPSKSDGEEDEDEIDEPDWAPKPKEKSNRGSEEAGLEDIKVLMLGRSMIAKYWAHPGFEDATVGCFSRVCIGQHPETGRSVYRLCIIKGWQDSRHIYEVQSKDGPIKFKRNAILAVGGDERPFRVDVISDSPPDLDEYRWWKGAMEVADLKRPTIATLEKKRAETKAVWQRQLTNEDFNLIRRKKYSYDPTSHLADIDTQGLQVMRAKLVREDGDEAEILKIDRELEWRAPPKSQSQSKPRTVGMESMGQINKRNREINRHEVRLAQLEEKKRNELAAKIAATNGDSSFMDPFARVKTYAKIYHDKDLTGGDKKNGNKEGEKMDELFGDDEAAAKEGAKEAKSAGLGKADDKVPQMKVRKPQGIDAVIASMDLKFDLDFD